MRRRLGEVGEQVRHVLGGYQGLDESELAGVVACDVQGVGELTVGGYPPDR